MILDLTPAQVSALQCAGLESKYDDDHPVTRRAWRAGALLSLVFDAADADALASELADLANSEDAQAEECMRLRGGERDVEGARAARGARDALTNLSDAVWRWMRGQKGERPALP